MERSDAGAGPGTEGPILFFSDAHLGVPDPGERRLGRLLDFLDYVREEASALYILGDLFDFWFEYRHAVPKGHFRMLTALAAIRQAGIPITYMAGNHDYWVGSFLREEIGVETLEDPVERRLQGRRVYLAHGDGLGPGDLGYRILKLILRHPVCIFLYRLLHPDLGIPLAHGVSALSRRHTLSREVLLARLYRDVARPLFDKGIECVVMGHVHEPAHLVVAGAPPRRELLVLGDWLENFTYGVFQEGTVRLLRWMPSGQPETIPPQPPPESPA
jgi:UDP-2,3-diacylglucosamine hydrolase